MFYTWMNSGRGGGRAKSSMFLSGSQYKKKSLIRPCNHYNNFPKSFVSTSNASTHVFTKSAETALIAVHSWRLLTSQNSLSALSPHARKATITITMSPIIGYPCHSLNDLACEDANSKLLNPVPDVNAINALTTVWCIWNMKEDWS